jgi:hypothetical protein
LSRAFSLRKIMFFVGPVAALALALVALFAVQTFSRTFAASSHTRYVGHTAGTNASCSSPGYTSVQAAVDAAHNGDTVYLCGTTPYAEQVIITKAITLTGDSGATIQAPATFTTSASSLPPQFASDNLAIPQAIVIVWGAGSNAKITNLHITGPLPGNGGCAVNEYGVLVIAGGKATLQNDHVTDIHDSNSSLYGCQFGVGIQVGRRHWPTADFSTTKVENFVGQATIWKVTVTGYQKNGITVDGPGSKANITRSTVQGAGRDQQFSVIIAQNGIEIARGAVGQVEDNSVSDNSYTGTAPASSGGILVFGGCGDPDSNGVEVEGNVLSNNDVGIYLNNYNANCNAPATQKTNDRALNNTISNDAVTNKGSYTASNGKTYNGYQAGIDDIGRNDLISHNTIAGIGYTPAQTTPPGPFVIPIDTISFPTSHPRVRWNKVI